MGSDCRCFWCWGLGLVGSGGQHIVCMGSVHISRWRPFCPRVLGVLANEPTWLVLLRANPGEGGACTPQDWQDQLLA